MYLHIFYNVVIWYIKWASDNMFANVAFLISDESLFRKNPPCGWTPEGKIVWPAVDWVTWKSLPWCMLQCTSQSFIHLLIHSSTHLFICLPIYHPSIYSSINPLIFPSFLLPSVLLSIHPSVPLSVWLPSVDMILSTRVLRDGFMDFSENVYTDYSWSEKCAPGIFILIG